MADSCANCFFFRAAPASAGTAAGLSFCHASPPYDHVDDSGYPWKRVQPDWWCKHGSDAMSGRAFDKTSQPGEGILSQGIIATSAGIQSYTIADAQIGNFVNPKALNASGVALLAGGLSVSVTKSVGFNIFFNLAAAGGENLTYTSNN